MYIISFIFLLSLLDCGISSDVVDEILSPQVDTPSFAAGIANAAGADADAANADAAETDASGADADTANADASGADADTANADTSGADDADAAVADAGADTDADTDTPAGAVAGADTIDNALNDASLTWDELPQIIKMTKEMQRFMTDGMTWANLPEEVEKVLSYSNVINDCNKALDATSLTWEELPDIICNASKSVNILSDSDSSKKRTGMSLSEPSLEEGEDDVERLKAHLRDLEERLDAKSNECKGHEEEMSVQSAEIATLREKLDRCVCDGKGPGGTGSGDGGGNSGGRAKNNDSGRNTINRSGGSGGLGLQVRIIISPSPDMMKNNASQVSNWNDFEIFRWLSTFQE